MKDARGHGSDSRSGGSIPAVPPSQSRYSPGATFSFGDRQAAAALGQDHPKSEPVATHSGTYNPNASTADNLAAFTAKYGGPRKHAATQRSFNSGRREINRLKRQGK